MRLPRGKQMMGHHPPTTTRHDPWVSLGARENLLSAAKCGHGNRTWFVLGRVVVWDARNPRVPGLLGLRFVNAGGMATQSWFAPGRLV